MAKLLIVFKIPECCPSYTPNHLSYSKQLLITSHLVIRLAASRGKRNVTAWRPYVCPSVSLFRRHTHRDSTEGEHGTRPAYTSDRQ